MASKKHEIFRLFLQETENTLKQANNIYRFEQDAVRQGSKPDSRRLYASLELYRKTTVLLVKVVEYLFALCIKSGAIE